MRVLLQRMNVVETSHEVPFFHDHEQSHSIASGCCEL